MFVTRRTTARQSRNFTDIYLPAGRILREEAHWLCGCVLMAIVELSTDKRLRYNWTIAYLCKSNGSPLIHSRKVATAVKYVLWFTKGTYEGKIVYDLIEAPADPEGTDKSFHLWGQSVDGVKEILRRLSKDGGVVCDPMCGGGSTMVAALELGGRKIIACDIDEKAVKTTKQRVRELFGHSK